MYNKFPNLEAPHFEELYGASQKDSRPHASSTTHNLRHIPSTTPSNKSRHEKSSANTRDIAYSIPGYSSWFDLSSINAIEVSSLPHFFSMPNPNHVVYKDWRNTIFMLYHDNPHTHLSIAMARKKVNCDITNLIRIYTFLEKWGLINYDCDVKSRCDNFGKRSKLLFESMKKRKDEKGGASRITNNLNVSCSICMVSMKSSGAERGNGVNKNIKGGADFYMNIKENGFICGNCFLGGAYETKYTADDYILFSENHLKHYWSKKEELKLLNLVDEDIEWKTIAVELNKTQTQCIMKYLKLQETNLYSESTNALLINRLSNPIMSVIAFLCGSVSPKIAADASRFCIERICEDENKDSNKFLPMAALSFAGEKANEHKIKEKEKIDELLKVLVELQIRKMELKLEDLEDLCKSLENERNDYKKARESYKKEYEEIKRRNTENKS